MTTFSVGVSVYYYGTSSLVTAYGPYSVTLSISPSATISGTLTMSTSSGQCTFSSLKILTAGTFTFTVSASGLNSYGTSSFTVVNYVKTMSISIGSTTPSINFSYPITVYLYGDDAGYYTGSVTVTLSCTGIAGTVTGANSGGTVSLNSVYFTSTGSYSLTASVPASGSYPAVSISVSITVLIEKLKITSFTAVFFM